MNQSTNNISRNKEINSEQVQLIDSHCHLDFDIFNSDRQSVLYTCATNGITDLVIPGVLAETWDSLLVMCHGKIIDESKNSDLRLHPAIGLHPLFVQQHKEEHLQKLDLYLSNHKVVAVGEIGLDFFDVKNKHASNEGKQSFFFEEQLKLAKKYELPVILHSRKSHDQILSLLKIHKIQSGGIAHAFNGSIQQAQQYISLGFKLGFGGMLTFERSTKLRSLAKQLPLESIVLETDSPDMTVVQHRGERNSPEYLPYVLEALADIRDESMRFIAAQTTMNVKTLLKL